MKNKERQEDCSRLKGQKSTYQPMFQGGNEDTRHLGHKWGNLNINIRCY